MNPAADNIREMCAIPGPRAPQPLVSLGDVPLQGAARPDAGACVEAWLHRPDTSGVLWLHGKAGRGKTTAAGAAIRRGFLENASFSPRGVKRVACFPGMCMEEVLDELSDFLAQMGCNSLGRVLGQRAFLCSRVAVLLEALQEQSLLVWLDDIDELCRSPLETQRKAEPVRYFLEGCRTLRGSNTRVVFTAEAECPFPDFDSTEVPALDPRTAARIWSEAGGPAELSPDSLPECWTRDPFSVSLLARLSARLGAQQMGALFLAGEKEVPDRAVEVALEKLSPEAVRLLKAVSVLKPGASRQALREVGGVGMRETVPGRHWEEEPLRELGGWGLVGTTEDRGAGTALAVPAPVRRVVEGRLRKDSPSVWRTLHAAAGFYYEKLASRSANVWHHLAAWREYFTAELYAEAYEAQKVFLQEILRRGYVEMARLILEETVRTSGGTARVVALGNLSILHKNAGEYDKALKTYREAQEEFIKLEDMPNLARVLHQIGNTYYVQGDYASALSSYRESLEISTEHPQPAVAVATKIQIGNVHYQCGDLKEALQSYLEALDETRAMGDSSLTALTALQISQVHLQEHRYLEAETYLSEAEAAGRDCGDLRNLVKVLEAQGTLAAKRRAYDEARARFDDALRTAESLGDSVEAAVSLVLAGDVEKSRLQLADALSCYERAKSRLESYGAQANLPPGEIRGLVENVEERIREMAESLGPEAFARIARRAHAGATGEAGAGARAQDCAQGKGAPV